MTYAAPRQGLFAIIILLSLSLNILFFVISQEHQKTNNNRHLVEKEALLLSQELTIPLNIGDRISMSVIANRHINSQDLAFIGIYDSKENLLVPVGKESNLGLISKEVVTTNGSVLGHVMVQSHDINRATIIAEHWLYLISILGLHTLLWLLYGYLAKPSKRLREEIAIDVRNRLLATDLLQSVHSDASHMTPPSQSSNDAEQASEPTTDKPTSTAYESTDAKSWQTDKLIIQVRFDDPNQLLETVSHQTKVAYFRLCHQLILKATQDLLTLPLLTDVEIDKVGLFDNRGCQIALVGKNPLAKTALAAIMLARLILMLNQTIYDKHRELKRFALPMRTFVSNNTKQADIITVGKKYRENPLVLLPINTIEQLTKYGNFYKLSNPVSVAERETRHLKQLSETNIQHLHRIRDQILLAD